MKATWTPEKGKGEAGSTTSSGSILRLLGLNVGAAPNGGLYKGTIVEKTEVGLKETLNLACIYDCVLLVLYLIVFIPVLL
jgi:hypothetical protein